MQCWKCKKEMDREAGGNHDLPGIKPRNKMTIKGVDVTVVLSPPNNTPENIEYYNQQLGKYSDGKGGCRVGICYECYIDNLFSAYPMVQNLEIKA